MAGFEIYRVKRICLLISHYRCNMCISPPAIDYNKVSIIIIIKKEAASLGKVTCF